MRWFSVRAMLVQAVLVIPLGVAVRGAGQDTKQPGSPAVGVTQVPTAADPKVAQIRALVEGSLDLATPPQSLFDVPLNDEAAVQIEATRLRALLRSLDEAARLPAADINARDKGGSLGNVDAGVALDEAASVDSARFYQRIELDRERLAFYELGAERRAEVLRPWTAASSKATPALSDLDVADGHVQAIKAAGAARNEAERRVSREIARLRALEARVHAVYARQHATREQVSLRRGVVFWWQQQVRNAKSAGASQADATYDLLRRSLRTSRADLSAALDALYGQRSDVPPLGSDGFADIPFEVPTKEGKKLRSVVQRAIADATHEEHMLRQERARMLLDEIHGLNQERLDLLPYLSPRKRDAITGLTAAGWDQARSEVRHLSLILRYHRHVARNWVRQVRSVRDAGITVWSTTAWLVPLLFVIVAFLWARRRTEAWLRWGEAHFASADRAAHRPSFGLGRRTVRMLRNDHRPLEWLLFFLSIMWLLPHSAQSLVEVQLISFVVGWSLASSLIVSTINAFAAGASALVPLEDDAIGRLRLRSLRLVGRTAVVFVLMLVLSSQLVGKGTIYAWVFWMCWYAALFVFLILVRWWRGTVFERLARLRKQTPLQRWILSHRSGYKSFVAAMIGAIQLFLKGAIKLGHGWLSHFDFVRRVHAYLFKREIERIGEGHAAVDLSALSAEVQQSLHPERPFRQWMPCPCDDICKNVVNRAVARDGGLLALVGSRGMGKSSLLHHLKDLVSDSVVIQCGAATSLSTMQASMADGAPLVLVDDAHMLLEPKIGGFSRVGEILSFARDCSNDAMWLFAFDATAWPLLKRARDARPMFDQTHVLGAWNEAQLGALLAVRSQAAGVAPSYDALIDRLPPGADEQDRQDALQAKREGYERMLWDYVDGNPGLALEAWRASLGQDSAGTVHVRPLQVPDFGKLEELPDSSLFVLRAVLQWAPATVDTVAQATGLRSDEVRQDFRFGKAQGFYSERPEGVYISWAWLRAVCRLLERHHVLVAL